MLTFNLKSKYYNMVISGEKLIEYRHFCNYWNTRVRHLTVGDRIKFMHGYSGEFVTAVFTKLDFVCYDELPKYAKNIFLDKKKLWWAIHFKLECEIDENKVIV